MKDLEIKPHPSIELSYLERNNCHPVVGILSA